MQRRGIDSTLVRAGLAACRTAGVRFVVVLGDPGFYERFGFERVSRRGLRNESGAESEFLVIQLVPRPFPRRVGCSNICA
ncbi:MAG: GNAT family N-acetyltransferase [Pyrinomonadaceae bacterium]